MATKYPDEVTLARSEVKYYNFTSTSFIKREIPTEKRDMDRFGKPITQRWLHERFIHEAAALNLLRSRTTIPVPRVISCGKDEHGLSYLETELVPDSVRCDMAGDECRMPELHLVSVECEKCRGIARQNADKFVRETVLPQLRTLKSNTTGLSGFVIPPGWVIESDEREAWQSRKSEEADFVFCHNDLTAYNILLNWRTLEVIALIHLEHSGYFPAEIQQWKYHGEINLIYTRMKIWYAGTSISLLQARKM